MASKERDKLDYAKALRALAEFEVRPRRDGRRPGNSWGIYVRGTKVCVATIRSAPGLVTSLRHVTNTVAARPARAEEMAANARRQAKRYVRVRAERIAALERAANGDVPEPRLTEPAQT